MSIGEKIITLRKERGWSQGDLAKKLNYLQPHVNRWEMDRMNPSLTALKKLAKLFSISIDALVFDEKDIKKLSIEDKDLLSKFKEFDKLSTSEKQSIIAIMDSLLKKRNNK